MKFCRCDKCNTETPADPCFGGPPETWATVVRVGQVGQVDQHFCSTRCAAEFFQHDLTRRGPSALELVR